jgi:hypothetical protein
MTVLAVVVLVQSGVLFWVMIQPDAREDVVAGLRRTPVVGAAVELCLPGAPSA